MIYKALKKAILYFAPSSYKCAFCGRHSADAGELCFPVSVVEK